MDDVHGGGFVPRVARVAEERIEAAATAVLMAHEIEADAVALVMISLATLRDEAELLRLHRRALAEVMDQIAMFDDRCGQGDVAGAVAALRGWIGKVRA